MRGFELNTQPVYLDLSSALETRLGLPAGQPVQIDGAAAEAQDYGILTVVAGVRYFVPWAEILVIRQTVTPDAPVNAVPVPAPVGTGTGSGSGNG